MKSRGGRSARKAGGAGGIWGYKSEQRGKAQKKKKKESNRKEENNKCVDQGGKSVGAMDIGVEKVTVG